MNKTRSPIPSDATFAQRHPTIVIFLHWFTVALVLTGVVLVLARDENGAGEVERLLLEQHRSIGLLVLGLVLLRFASRIWHWDRLMRHDLPWTLQLASGAAHVGLYVLMVSTALLGWALTSAHGQDLSLFGLWTLPPLIPADDDLAATLADWHALSAWSLIALIAAHGIAALWHHFIRRDDVLRAMLPWREAGHEPTDQAISSTCMTPGRGPMSSRLVGKG